MPPRAVREALRARGRLAAANDLEADPHLLGERVLLREAPLAVRRKPVAAQTALRERGDLLDEATVSRTREIVEKVRREGESALRRLGEEFDGLAPDAPMRIERGGLEAAFAGLDAPTRALLTRSADRIRSFAERQRACLLDLEFPRVDEAKKKELSAAREALEQE